MGKVRVPSIVYYLDRCAATGCTECAGRLEYHEIFFGTSKNRSYSRQDGLWVALCSKHHRGYEAGVHGGNRALDLQLKEVAEKRWLEERPGRTIDQFISRYGKNYLDAEEDK